ncbi:MAG: protein-glutamate O-methyltransferase CheR [Verrucomicrobiota bacterium]
MPTSSDALPISIPDGIPRLLRDLIHERTGLFFDTDRTDLMIEKLLPRVELRKCRSYLDYYYILKYDDQSDAEWLRVMDVFSVQETYFWREYSQIEALVTDIVPTWFKTHASPLRIWSAACASGEEPYSIAMALDGAGLGHLPVEIYASDASEAALERARIGTYRERSFRALSPALRGKYFTQVPEGWQLSDTIRSRVQFRRANLAAPGEIDALAQASVIFCRNVFIYFSPDSIRRTVGLFAQRMRPPGYLFVGSSESLIKISDAFELQEIADAFVYLRKAGT